MYLGLLDGLGITKCHHFATQMNARVAAMGSLDLQAACHGISSATTRSADRGPNEMDGAALHILQNLSIGTTLGHAYCLALLDIPAD